MSSNTSDWEEVKRPDGLIYYYNKSTGETSWTKSIPGQTEWWESKAPDGRTYYWNPRTRGRTFVKPPPADPIKKISLSDEEVKKLEEYKDVDTYFEYLQERFDKKTNDEVLEKLAIDGV